MTTQTKTVPAAYAHALALLKGRESRKVDHNTYALLHADGRVTVRLYATNILTFYPNGDVAANSGGYRTATTKDRINKFLPFARVSQVKHEWQWGNGAPFVDGAKL